MSKQNISFAKINIISRNLRCNFSERLSVYVVYISFTKDLKRLLMHIVRHIWPKDEKPHIKKIGYGQLNGLTSILARATGIFFDLNIGNCYENQIIIRENVC